MRARVAVLVVVALTAGAVSGASAAVAPDRLPTEWPVEAEAHRADVAGAPGGRVANEATQPLDGEQNAPDGAAVVPYRSGWGTVQRDIASLTEYSAGLTDEHRRYAALRSDLGPRLAALQERESALTQRLAELGALEVMLTRQLTDARSELAVLERQAGALARLLYTQPAPELNALAQLLEGEDLRAFDRQNLVTGVLTSRGAEVARTREEVERLSAQLRTTRGDIASAQRERATVSSDRHQVAAQLAVVEKALTEIDDDAQAARAAIDEIRRAELVAIRAAVEAAAAADRADAEAQMPDTPSQSQAAPRSEPPARPTGGGTAAKSTGDFRAALPQGIPYRDVFLTYGLRYRVEPAVLAAIARQESNFDPWAGCSRAGAGKGIMQHEGQARYCGPQAVAASVEKSARMLAAYYNRGGSWQAAMFAYNNGPGLMDEWVRFGSNPPRLLAVLAQHYNASPWASPGPKHGYPTWGDWRAAVAYSYAATRPLAGMRSAAQTWLIYRQG